MSRPSSPTLDSDLCYIKEHEEVRASCSRVHTGKAVDIGYQTLFYRPHTPHNLSISIQSEYNLIWPHCENNITFSL